jgi:NAD(P)-dependent dehydrogenase (short-subunit alcohol dehydrogenase family)
VTAVFFTVQAAAPHLNDGASVILNGSVHAAMGVPGYSAYAAKKGGLRSMTRNLASELAPRRIRVNQLTPGGTKTGISAPHPIRSPAWIRPLGRELDVDL